jgi:hypothetical protein
MVRRATSGHVPTTLSGMVPEVRAQRGRALESRARYVVGYLRSSGSYSIAHAARCQHKNVALPSGKKRTSSRMEVVASFVNGPNAVPLKSSCACRLERQPPLTQVIKLRCASAERERTESRDAGRRRWLHDWGVPSRAKK